MIGFVLSVSLAGVVLSSASAVCQAPPTWTQPGTNFPGIRVSYPLSTDSVRNRVLLFGGIENSDTWEWDGSQWLLRIPATSPSWRHGPSIAYDSQRGEHVMFGGSEYGNILDETWIWDGSNWVRRFPVASPGPRREHLLVHDVLRNVTILYGGWDGAVTLSDTWSWDGANWTRLFPVHSPGPWGGRSCTYDSGRSEIVMYGAGPSLTETWIWNGIDWVQRSTQVDPGPRANAGMAFHSPSGRAVLFGGESPAGTFLGGTWSWDGQAWTQLSPIGAPCNAPPYAAAFDPVTQNVLMFIGHPWTPCGTWLLQVPAGPNASWATRGVGCMGSAGIPTLTPVANPVIGRSFVVALGNAPAGFNIAFAVIGFSTTAWGFVALPADLASQGMPGCALYTDPFLAASFVGTPASAQWAYPIPANSLLSGLQFHIQALVPDPQVPNPSNQLGAVTTNALSGIIGY